MGALARRVQVEDRFSTKPLHHLHAVQLDPQLAPILKQHPTGGRGQVQLMIETPIRIAHGHQVDRERM